MNERPSIPGSISYRDLQAFAQNAPAEPAAGTGDRPETELATLDSALEAWNRTSQELLRSLQQAGPTVGPRLTPRQLMALGALQAHVSMGLQALASSRRSRD